MKSPSTPVENIKAHLDELILQLSLGKAEALEFIEEHKGKFLSIIEETGGKVEDSPEVDEDRTAMIRQRLEELRVQLALGKMEGQEQLKNRAEQINEAIQGAQKDIEPLKESATEVLRDLAGGFESGSESFKDKLHALAINLGLGELVEDEKLKEKKEEVTSQIKDIAEDIKPIIEEKSAAVEELSKEIQTAVQGLRENLRQLLN